MAEKDASEYFTIEVEGHGSKLLHNLNRARLEERFCDFKIQVGKQIIHAHKNVLAEGCDYFRAMLSHPMKEANEGIVEMVDVDFECLEICVEYIYLGKIKVTKEKLQSLLEIAHRLQLNELCNEAAKNLEDDLSLDTFFTTNSVATSLELKDLREKCDNFALKNLTGIALKEDFVKIDLKYLEFLMTAKVPPEIKCKAFLIWANHDADNRGKEFEKYFLTLDLNQFPSSYTTFLEQNEALFFNSIKCLRKLLQSKSSTNTGKDIDFTRCRGRTEFSKFAVFDKTSNAIQAYDPDENTWAELHVSIELRHSMSLRDNFVIFKSQKLAPEISSLSNFTAATVDEHIFVFARDQRNWKVRYSDENSTWSPLPNRTITKYVEAVEVDGLIYAFDETDGLSKAVEVYDGAKWSHVADKPVANYRGCIVAVEDSIYCIGGYSSNYQSHCNKYETGSKCWSSLPSMPDGRIQGSAAVLDRKIYVIGGYEAQGSGAAVTALVFDVETKAWTKIASMTNRRFDFRVVPIAGKIFSIGGEESKDTVEEFNPSTGKWRTVMTLSGKQIVGTASVAL